MLHTEIRQHVLFFSVAYYLRVGAFFFYKWLAIFKRSSLVKAYKNLWEVFPL